MLVSRSLKSKILISNVYFASMKNNFREHSRVLWIVIFKNNNIYPFIIHLSNIYLFRVSKRLSPDDRENKLLFHNSLNAILLKYTNVNIDRSLIFQTIFQYVHIGDGKWVVRDKRWMLVLLIRFTIGGILGHRVYSAFPTVSLHSLSRWKIEEV